MFSTKSDGKRWWQVFRDSREAGSRPSRKRGVLLETLEKRELMAANLIASLSGGLLKLEGTDQNDTVVVRQYDNKTFVDSFEGSAGVRRTQLSGVVNRIEFSGLKGDDFIAFRALTPSVGIDIKGGNGADLAVTEADSYFSELASASSARLIDGINAFASESGNYIRDTTDEEGNRFKVTYKDGRRVHAEAWNLTGGYTHLTWNVDGSMERVSFQNQQLTQIEVWEVNDVYRRVLAQDANTLVREMFVGDQLRIREQEDNGQLTRTAWNASRESLLQVFQNGKITLQETRASDGTISTSETLGNSIKKLNDQQAVDVTAKETSLQDLGKWRSDTLANATNLQTSQLVALGSTFQLATDLRDNVSNQWTQWRETQTGLQNKALQVANAAQDKLASEWSAWQSTNLASWNKYLSDMQSSQTKIINDWTTWRDSNVATWNKYGTDMSNWRNSTFNSWTSWRNANVKIQTDYMDNLQSWANSELRKIGLSLKSIGFGLTGVSIPSFSSAVNTAISKGQDVNASINGAVAQVGQMAQGAVNSSLGKSQWVKDRANSIRNSLTSGLNQAKANIASVVGRANTVINDANDKLRTAQTQVSKEVNSIQTRANGVINDAKSRLNAAKDAHSREIVSIQSRAANEIKVGVDRLNVTKISVSKEIGRIQATANTLINDATSKWNEALNTFNQETAKVRSHATEVIKDAEDKWNTGKKVLADDIVKIRTQVLDDVRTVTEKWQVLTQWSTDRWNSFENWSSDRWDSLADWASDRWENSFGKFATDSGDHSSEVFNVKLTSLDNNRYQVDTAVAFVYGGLRGLRMTVSRDGQRIEQKYVATGDDDGYITKIYGLEFTAEQVGEYKITIELKDSKGKWYASVTGDAVQLPMTGSRVIFSREHPLDRLGSDSRGGDGGATQSGSTETVSPVTKSWVISEAERKRGFVLPYVFASAGIYAVHQDNRTHVILGFDMVETTDETEVEVSFKSQNLAGAAINSAGQSQREFEDQIEKAITYQKNMAIAYANFPAWYAEGGPALKDDWIRDNQYKDSIGEPTESFEEWILNFRVVQEYEGNFPGRVGTLAEAMKAETRIQELRSQTWTQEKLPSFMLKGTEAISKGLNLSDVITQRANRQYELIIVVREAAGTRPDTITLADPLNATLIKKAAAEKVSSNKWLDLRQRIQDASETRLQASRDSEAVRGLRSVGVNRGIKEVFEMSQKDAEDLFSTAVPGFGFFMNLGNTYMYAKEGNVAGAAVEGSFALLSILTSGIIGKAGKLVPNASGKTATKVVELDAELVAKGSKTIADGLIAGANKMKTIAEQARVAGYKPTHVQSISQYANLQQQMIVFRAANPISMKYHNVSGYKPKPGLIPLLPDTAKNSSLKDVKFLLKTDVETGLVKGTRAADGTLLDARGAVTDFVVSDVVDKKTGWQAIHTAGQDGMETGLRLNNEGFIIDFQGNRFFSDYDLMGVYEDSTNAVGKFQPTTVGESFISQLNLAIDKSLQIVQHGANDAYWKIFANEVKHAGPGVGDLFMVVHPNSTIEFRDFAGLMKLYESKGIPLPID